MPLRIRGKIDYSMCKPQAKPIVLKETRSRVIINRGTPWSDDEKRTLKKLIADGITVKRAAAFYPTRTSAAVAHMASIMGLIKGRVK